MYTDGHQVFFVTPVLVLFLKNITKLDAKSYLP